MPGMKFKLRIISLIVTLVVGFIYYVAHQFNSNIITTTGKKIYFDHKPSNSCYIFNRPNTDLSSFEMMKVASIKLSEDHKSKASGEIFPDINALKSKPKDDPLTIFVIPHSHNDPAWTKTFEDYYSDQTSKILNNVLTYLHKYKNMTFLWTETVFLNRWWPDLSKTDQEKFLKFVKEGRLEIAGGGWIAPDEATTTIHGLIENLIQGHSWLAENLPGISLPKTWWNLDPFGYSSVGAYLATKAGYEQSTILRVNSYVKDIMQRNRQLEFNWTPDWLPADHAKKFATFTSILPFLLYNIKYSCGPHPQVCLKFDFRAIPGEISESLAQPINEYNINYLSELLQQELRYKSQMFQHNVGMFLLGDDFRYDREAEWEQQYENFEKIFKFMNKQSKWNIKIRFGTPNDYFQEAKRKMIEQGDKIPSLKGDFYTYYDRDWAFWSGYFTSRPYFKWLARSLGHHLRTAEILTSLKVLTQSERSPHANRGLFRSLQSAREMYSFFHHHDSITGTSGDEVTRKYLTDLTSAISQTHSVISMTLSELLKDQLTVVDVEFQPDGPVIPLPKSDSILLYLLNSVTQNRTDCVSFQVHSSNFHATWYDKNSQPHPINCQLSPAFENGRMSDTLFEVTVCLNVGAWSVQPLLLTTSGGGESAPCKVASVTSNGRFLPRLWTGKLWKTDDAFISLRGSKLLARFDSNSGLMREAAVGPDSQFMRVNLRFQYYQTRGGSYLFMPQENAPPLESLFERPLVSVVQGDLVSYVRVQQNAYCHTVRLYNVPDTACHLNDVFVIENLVNLQTEVKDFSQKELFMRIDTGIQSRDVFYTDSNNVFLTKRQRLKSLPLEGNYYPITSSLVIEDANLKMNILTNHAHGVTSRSPGSVEVMLQRSATNDDERGNGDALNFDHPAVSRMFLYFEDHSGPLGGETAFLSLSAALYSRYLNHPLTSLLRSGGGDTTSHIQSSALLPSLALSCNMEVLNLRWSPTGGHILAVIRNLPIPDCPRENWKHATGSICSNNGFSSLLSFRRHLFGAVTSLKSVSLSNLSGVKRLLNLEEPNLEFSMVPGDFYTFVLRY